MSPYDASPVTHGEWQRANSKPTRDGKKCTQPWPRTIEGGEGSLDAAGLSTATRTYTDASSAQYLSLYAKAQETRAIFVSAAAGPLNRVLGS